MANLVTLASIGRGTARTKPEGGGCGATGGSSCGSSAGEADLPAEIWNKIKDHPCYSEEAHHYFARMHVAVAPACNIQCHYCNRKYDCSNESRPGVVSEKLTPEQALSKVLAVAAEVPQLSVLGIAGPGDALANPEKTFKTFELVSSALPHLKLCLSTNGLMLPDYVERIAAFNVEHVTITINMVDPAIGEKIYPWIFYDHKRWTGREAAEILHQRQMEGLSALTARGILVKVNSVLIPGINDEHLAEVNKEVRKRGAFLHNIMPLISDPAHGTHFGLSGQRGPTHAELKTAQDRLGPGAKLMRHCRQCRADAVGLLGEDRGADFALDKLTEVSAFDPAKRDAYLDVVMRERADRRQARIEAEAALRDAVCEKPSLVAVATRGGGRINMHFGKVREFQIYEVNAEGARFVGHRRTDAYCTDAAGDEAALDDTIKALAGIDALFCVKIGEAPRHRLEEAGIDICETYAFDYIEASIIAWYVGRKASIASQTA